PKYASFDRPFTPDTAMERPPRSGPTLRQRKELKNADSDDASAGAAAGVCCALAPNCQALDARRMRTKAHKKSRFIRASVANLRFMVEFAGRLPALGV